jgi:hypothetical protein
VKPTYRRLQGHQGFVAWEGKSPVTGDPMVLIITGGSHNEKTGPMAQGWLLLRDISPMEAAKTGKDDAICGLCVHRGTDGGRGRTCYVNLFQGARQVWQAFQAGKYRWLTLSGAAAMLDGSFVRVTAYGDPAFVPFPIWQGLLSRCGHVGYTHQWRSCDQRFRQILMASVDTPLEQTHAVSIGWRTFRDRTKDQGVLPGEFICPASAEGAHKATCLACQLCGGQGTPARHPVIFRHGKREAQPGAWGKHRATYAALDRGEAVQLMGTPNDRQRVGLAIRQHYLRQGQVVTGQIHSRALPGGFEFWKGTR